MIITLILNWLLTSTNIVINIIKNPIIYNVSLKFCFNLSTSFTVYFSNNAEHDPTIVDIPKKSSSASLVSGPAFDAAFV